MLGTTITREQQKEACLAMQKAFLSGDEKEIQEAMTKFHESVAESIKQDYLEADGDRTILAQRGYRQLTAEETKFYEKLVQAAKDPAPKQALTTLISGNGMPETIIEDVYRNLIDEHPLLSRISFTNVKYLTRFILNDHTVQKAIWGTINSEITQEITSSFKVVSLAQCKLTAYALIDKDMLDLGPTYLDNYVRTVLQEALACGLEAAIVSGNGHNCPIGLDRDIHDGVSVNSSTGYPQKTPVKVTSFLPADYGKLLATLAKTEKGRLRKFDEVTMICNQIDYLTKIMPATTVLNNMGLYSKDVFPFPTEVIRSNEVAEGQAIICLPDEYFFGIGSSKEGNIEFSDEFKFLEDMRTLKIKLYGMGKAFDNTVAILIDISKLDPTYITVKNVAAAAGA